MEQIIMKAIQGGFPDYLALISTVAGINPSHAKLITLEPRFWECLGIACKWKPKWDVFDTQGRPRRIPEFRYHAYKFHELNFTKGWEKAVEYLQEVTK